MVVLSLINHVVKNNKVHRISDPLCVIPLNLLDLLAKLIRLVHLSFLIIDWLTFALLTVPSTCLFVLAAEWFYLWIQDRNIINQAQKIRPCCCTTSSTIQSNNVSLCKPVKKIGQIIGWSNLKQCSSSEVFVGATLRTLVLFAFLVENVLFIQFRTFHNRICSILFNKRRYIANSSSRISRLLSTTKLGRLSWELGVVTKVVKTVILT